MDNVVSDVQHAAPLSHAWPATAPTKSGMIDSEIDIARVLGCAEQPACFSFNIYPCFWTYLPCVELNQSTAVGVVGAIRLAILPALARATPILVTFCG